ncbi:MAG: hypothetical protein K2K98_02230 [Muribaculaceae bacterium]|nr:hypothetical protein [Muribaculaceae bacterium]
MSILNPEELNAQIERAVEVVYPVEKDFKKQFNDGNVPVLLIDPRHEIDVRKVAEENNALYIDLSTPIDYPQLCRIALDNRSIIFDNIDNIPDTEDREYIQYLVKYALRKEEDVPTPDNTYFSFTNRRIGARCRQAPDYLYEGSKACPIYCVVPQD